MNLQTTDSVALVELWTVIKNYVVVKDQRACADQFIATITEAGLVDIDVDSSHLYGVCDLFDKALRQYIEDNGMGEEDHSDWNE
jgi:hypothetical protein